MTPSNRQTNIIVHVEIAVVDIHRAMNFYRDVLDIAFKGTTEIHGNTMAFFPFEEGKDGASGALVQGEVYVPSLKGAIVYFGVHDLDAVLAKSQALGSKVLFPKAAVGENHFVAEITDSEGNRIALQT